MTDKYKNYQIIFDPHFLECRVIDPWNCLTYTSYCHKLWRHLGYEDKSLLTFQDVDDSVSSKGELEWLLFMEKKLGYPLERQKVLPYKHTVQNGKSVYKK